MRYGGTDSSATMVPFRRYYQLNKFFNFAEVSFLLLVVVNADKQQIFFVITPFVCSGLSHGSAERNLVM